MDALLLRSSYLGGNRPGVAVGLLERNPVGPGLGARVKDPTGQACEATCKSHKKDHSPRFLTEAEADLHEVRGEREAARGQHRCKRRFQDDPWLPELSVA